ncbi:proteasome assembly chaperone family protein [Brevibacterium litoralis]|uniref:proteasome assembly chaperone family protein n=1 Tax=Brevibacterium litoralis TaxID=3138935 RepID=UPI0032EBDC28
MSFLPPAGSRLVVIAFEGWNDAGEAAVDTARHLVEEWDLQLRSTTDCQSYFDMTFIRPVLHRGPEGPTIDWPQMRRFGGTVPGSDTEIEVWVGVEPSYRWQEFVDEILADLREGDHVILLGALLADVVHTRPLPVSPSTESTQVQAALGIPAAEYEGPTGIIGVFAADLYRRGVPEVSLWVAVPGYAATTPNPKAILALLATFEEITGLVVAQRELVEEARAWEAGTDAMVEDDEDLSEHVERLEGMTDASELPEASGDAIAREFEKYLSRREDGRGHPGEQR